MKRTAILFLSIFVIAFSASFPSLLVVADGNGSASLTDASGERDEEVVLYVELTQNPGLITFRMQVSYPDGIVLQSVENSGILNGWTAPSPTISSPYTLRWADALATANNTATGIIATLRFRISDAAQSGANVITVEVPESRDVNGTKLSFTGASATITVVDPAEQPSSAPAPETQPVMPSTSEPETEAESEEESSESVTYEDETETEEELPQSSAEAETEEIRSAEESEGGENPIEKPETDSETESAPDRNSWILPVVLGVVLLAGAVGAFFFVTKKK